MMGVKVARKAADAFSFVNCEVKQSDELSLLPVGKVVGNGRKKSGAQNYLCKGCNYVEQMDKIYKS
jgi:hypothetical protein